MKRRRKLFFKTAVRRRLIACLVVVAVIGCAFAFDGHFIPLISRYARSRAEWFATRAVNEAATAVLASQKPTYNELVKVSAAEDGTVTALAVNTSAVNLLKSEVTLAALARVGEQPKIKVSIPLGTLLGSHYFTGRGPFVSVPVGMSGNVLTDIKSEFTAAGINQTRHRLVLEVKTTVFAAIPTAHTSVEVNTTLIIAESILLGKIPEAYTVVENIDEETVGEIFDYGAQLEK